MTCTGCQAKVQSLLLAVPGVKQVDIDLEKGKAAITMSRHIDTGELKNALKKYEKYQITEEDIYMPESVSTNDEEEKTWLQTYQPILLIFAYILGVTLLVESGGFDLMRWMQNFMAGFFLVFSFFKLLDLNGFADSYSTYDIIAKKWRGWGYVYAFTELALGVAFLTRFNSLATNVVTFVVMSVSIIGVLQSVLNKRKIRCACLGAVFNIPMSTVTIIEDALMIIMSAIMLINIL